MVATKGSMEPVSPPRWFPTTPLAYVIISLVALANFPLVWGAGLFRWMHGRLHPVPRPKHILICHVEPTTVPAVAKAAASD